MGAPVVELSPEVFERLEAYRRKHGLSSDQALLRLLEQDAGEAPYWLEAQLANVLEEDEEVSPATRRRIEAARRSLKRDGGVPADRAGR